jgi:hypothetical protein
MDQIVPIRLSDADRQSLITARARELMLAGGMTEAHLTQHGPAWTAADAELRDRSLKQAQDEIAIAHGIAVWTHPGEQDETIDWSEPPRIGLRRALAERDRAKLDRDKAGAVAQRAAERVKLCEAELDQCSDLDEQIDQFHLQALREGTNSELPYALSVAAQDRDRGKDRLEHAIRANRTVTDELRQAERHLQQQQSVVGRWATKIILDHAEQLAAEWQAVQNEADARRAMLHALSYAHFPAQGGPPSLSPRVLGVIKAENAPPDQTLPAIEPRKAEWLALHATILADPEFVIDLR